MPFTNLDNERDNVTAFLNTLETKVGTAQSPIADIANNASGTEIATAVNSIIAALVAAGILNPST